VVMVMLLVLQLIAGVGFTMQVLAAPVILGVTVALALGIGTWAAALCVQYRDVAYVLPVFLQFLLFGSPVLYSDRLAEKFGQWAFVAYLNPLWGLLGAWKWSVLSTPFPPMWAFVYAVSVSLALLFVGVMVFRRMERNFADVI
jgi:lipopolysaccharide transport system permease protein